MESPSLDDNPPISQDDEQESSATPTNPELGEKRKDMTSNNKGKNKTKGTKFSYNPIFDGR